MSAVYEHGGLGESPIGGIIAAGFPDRDNGPNTRLGIHFPNGITLSLVWGWGAYCGPDTVEVAVIGPEPDEPDDDDLCAGWLTEHLAKELFGEDIGDSVDGWCDAERVHSYFLAAQARKGS